MKRKLLTVLALLFFISGFSQKMDLVLTNCNVITMKSNTILKNRTILIKGNKIHKIIKSNQWKNNSNVPTIDCTDKFVIPSLVDMHIHSNAYIDTYSFPMFLKYGITTLRVMAGNDAILKKRDSIKAKLLTGLPDIYVASELIDGNPPSFGADHFGPIVTEKDQIIPIIEQQISKGYDFIKLYSRLNQNSYKEALTYCKSKNIKVASHIPTALDKKDFFSNITGEIQHLSGYARYANSSGSIPKNILIKNYDVPFDEISAKTIDSKKLDDAVIKTVKNKIWNCPTLVLFYNKTDTTFCKSILENKIGPGLDGLLDWWKNTGYGNNTQLKNYTDFQHQTVQLLHNKKAQLLAGTDFPNPWLVPGLSLHQELERFTNSGLTNYEALKTATVNPALWFGKKYQKGYVAKDKIADLIILNKNPLTDIKNTLTIYSVVHDGVVITNDSVKK